MSTTSEKKPSPTTQLARRLQPSLSLAETSVCTAAWTLSVLYSIYHVYCASRREMMHISLIFRVSDVSWFHVLSALHNTLKT